MKPVVYYDCGVHGKLTVGDVAYRANIHRSTAAARLKRGYRDERLFLPSWGSHRRQVPCADAGLALRFRFALHYAGRVPSIADIRRDFPELGRSCLYRWHKALQAAHLAKGAELQDKSAASPARCRITYDSAATGRGIHKNRSASRWSAAISS